MTLYFHGVRQYFRLKFFSLYIQSLRPPILVTEYRDDKLTSYVILFLI